MNGTLFDLEPQVTATRPRRAARAEAARAPSGAVQLDLSGHVDAALARRAAWDALRADREAARHLDCCTGEPVPRGTFPPGVIGADGASTSWPRIRCGRCGQLADSGPYDINHRGGWTGCAFRRDAHPLNATPREHWRWIARRHDRLHRADCRCGHPWGHHDDRFTPGAWLTGRARCEDFTRGCGCARYEPGPNSPDLPSRWGTSWVPPDELMEALRVTGGIR